MGDYDRAIKTLTEYRVYASFSDQEALKEWQQELEEKKDQAEELAQLRNQEAKRKEEARKKEEERITQEKEEKRLAEEERKRKEEERRLAEEERKKSKIPMWSAWSATALTGAGTAYFLLQANQNRQFLDQYCDSSTGFCLENADVPSSFTSYKQNKTLGYVSLGLALTTTSLSLWQTSKHLQISPNSITWEVTW